MKYTWLMGLGVALLVPPVGAAASAVAGVTAKNEDTATGAADRTKPVSRGDFAEGIILTPSAERAIHTLLLPDAVYRGVAQRDFIDLRVYNGAGQPVPHAVRPLPEFSYASIKSSTLPLFPLRETPGSPDPKTALVLYASRDAGGAILTIRPEHLPPEAAAADASAQAGEIVAYVVDASASPQPIDALEITLGPEPGDYVLPIIVEASDDLSDFRRVGKPQSLVRLEYGGQRIERKRIELPPIGARYLRLSWTGPLRRNFQTVRAESGRLHRADNLVSFELSGRWTQPGELALYDLGGPLPVDRVRVLVPEDNSIISTTLEGASAPEGPFRVITQGNFYRVRHEGELFESPAVNVGRTQDRFLRLRLSRQGGGGGAEPPKLEVSRHPDQLLFAARGGPPFELVFGHHGASASAFAPDELLTMLPPGARSDLPPSDTTGGEVHPLAGPAARTPPPPRPPLKKYALWGVLIATVGALALMALRLARAERD